MIMGMVAPRMPFFHNPLGNIRVFLHMLTPP